MQACFSGHKRSGGSNIGMTSVQTEARFIFQAGLFLYFFVRARGQDLPLLAGILWLDPLVLSMCSMLSMLGWAFCAANACFHASNA